MSIKYSTSLWWGRGVCLVNRMFGLLVELILGNGKKGEVQLNNKLPEFCTSSLNPATKFDQLLGELRTEKYKQQQWTYPVFFSLFCICSSDKLMGNL